MDKVLAFMRSHDIWSNVVQSWYLIIAFSHANIFGGHFLFSDVLLSSFGYFWEKFFCPTGSDRRQKEYIYFSWIFSSSCCLLACFLSFHLSKEQWASRDRIVKRKRKRWNERWNRKDTLWHIKMRRDGQWYCGEKFIHIW